MDKRAGEFQRHLRCSISAGGCLRGHFTQLSANQRRTVPHSTQWKELSVSVRRNIRTPQQDHLSKRRIRQLLVECKSDVRVLHISKPPWANYLILPHPIQSPPHS